MSDQFFKPICWTNTIDYTWLMMCTSIIEMQTLLQMCTRLEKKLHIFYFFMFTCVGILHHWYIPQFIKTMNSLHQCLVLHPIRISILFGPRLFNYSSIMWKFISINSNFFFLLRLYCLDGERFKWFYEKVN